ncbi:MAG: FkbM family methyltransferase [Planctomycetota bacterium]
MSRLLLLLARRAPWRALRRTAFRKYCRRNAGLALVARCRGGIRLAVEIGDSVDDQLAVYGVYEPGTTEVLRRLAVDAGAFVDVGCNLGYYGCLVGAENPALPVVAIDANPAMVERAEDNMRRNEVDGAEVLHCGVGAEEGRLELSVPRDRHSLSSFAYVPKKGGPSETITVPVRPLGPILSERALASCLLKIDAEGFEYEVFRGLGAGGVDRVERIVCEISVPNLGRAGRELAELFALPVFEEFRPFRIRETVRDPLRETSYAELADDPSQHGNVLLVRRDAAAPLL